MTVPASTAPSAGHFKADVVIADRYRLGPLLGRGGMAEVYDGRDLRLERPVAVKLLLPEMAAREDIRTRFEAEARAAAGLSHPNAVAVFDTGEHEGVPYLVMERLPGETLADRLAQGPVDPAWATEMARQVLGALSVAHASGIVHRDVKPANILLTAGGTAKIADFGIAKSVQQAGMAPDGRLDLTMTGQVLGTPAYVAPERLEGMPTTPQADLYALGVVLYEALAGSRPFTGAGPMAVARAVTEGDHVPLDQVRPDLDAGLVATVERAMALHPEDRFPTAEAMAAALDGSVDATQDVAAGLREAAGAGGTMVLPASPAAGARAGGRRWGLVAAGALALLLMFLLVRAATPDVEPVVEGTESREAQEAPVTTSAPTTAAPAVTPAKALAASLRDVAEGLKPSDGARAEDFAKALRAVASKVEDGGGGAEATALIVTAAQWIQSGQLSAPAAMMALPLLQQVPGVGQPSVAPPASTHAPAPSAGHSSDRGKGKGNDDDKDD